MIVFLLVLSGVLYLVNRRALRWLRESYTFSPRTMRALAAVLYAALLTILLGRVLGHIFPELPLAPALAVAFSVEIAALVSVILLLPFDLALWLYRVAPRVHARVFRTTPPPNVAATSIDVPLAPAQLAAPPTRADVAEAPLLPRRSLIVQATVGSAFLIGGSSSLYGSLSGRHDYQIEDAPVRLPGLPRALDGFTIVQLSDIHVGQFVGSAELAAAEDLVRQARADLIVLTGDLIDHDPRYAETLGQFTRRLLPLAREGVVAISGNHDFYAGIDPVVSALRRAGADVLRNRGRIIGDARTGFALIGVDDVWARRMGGGPDLEAAVRSLSASSGSSTAAHDLPRVLLCHNPSFFEEAAGKVGLQLSGHTHGGQFNLLVRPADWVLKNGWVAGHYQHRGSRLYVNRGFGTAGPPARVGAPPEITRIVLTA